MDTAVSIGLFMQQRELPFRDFPSPGVTRHYQTPIAPMTSTDLQWKRTRVLLTGGAGFLGRAVHDKLRDRGAEEVFVVRSAEYDLTREDSVARLFRDTRPEVVLHLAAEVGGIGANVEKPGRFYFANAAMGLHLIEQARVQGVQKFIQVGTICAYPENTPVPFREDDLWRGFPEPTNAPYGIAKKALLIMLQAYRRQYGMRGIYLLPVNLYGPGDNFDLDSSHVIPAMIRKLSAARDRGASSVELWGTGRASREFLYVSDCAEGILLAAEKFDGPEPVNLGTNKEIVIRDLARKIGRLVGYQGTVAWDSSMPDGQLRRCLDTSRAQKLFGFSAETSLDCGLAETVRWWEGESRDRPST